MKKIDLSIETFIHGNGDIHSVLFINGVPIYKMNHPKDTEPDALYTAISERLHGFYTDIYESIAQVSEQCQNCKYWETGAAPISNCRKNAPIGRNDISPVFPPTRQNDWCGDWETK